MRDLRTSFQALLLQELMTEAGLVGELGVEEQVRALCSAAQSSFETVSGGEGDVPYFLVDRAIDQLINKECADLLERRTAADVAASAKSSEAKYDSCCRSALCYAAAGHYRYAFGALRVAASVDDRWARHHQIYGLIHGVEGNVDGARFELSFSLEREPYSEKRRRIELGLSLLPA
jgi:hypothetical protein